MKTTVVKFSVLADLALFVKLVKPNGYRLNTLCLTLTAPLSAFELALAIEQYGATQVEREPVAE